MNSEHIAVRILGILVRITLVIVAGYFIVRAAYTAYDYGYLIFAQKAVAEEGRGETKSVTIRAGDGAKETGEKLKEAGLISDARLFRLQELFSDYHGKITPGEYELSTEMTPEQMLEIMGANAVSAVSEEEQQEGSSVIGAGGDDEDRIPVPEGGEDAENGEEGENPEGTENGEEGINPEGGEGGDGN